MASQLVESMGSNGLGSGQVNRSGPDADLEDIARRIRATLVELSHKSGAAHLGSSLSCVDVLVAAYWRVLRIDPQRPDEPNRDRFILSKGHAATTLYSALAYRGFFPLSDLETFAQAGGHLPAQPSPGCAPGVEAATGSLGHGLPLGVGMALANRIQGRDGRVFVLMSDGECNEGSVWEAAMFAPVHRLDKLAVVIDFNQWQATGRSTEVMALQPLAEKFHAFGWNAYNVDGHDIGAVASLLVRVPYGDGKPLALVARTVKGKGVSFMEDDNNWHYRIPTADEVVEARRELKVDVDTAR